MAKYVGGSEYAQPKVNPIQQGVLSGVQEISKQVQVARVQKLLDDPRSTPIQRAMALASLGHEKLGSDLLKQQANQSALQQIQENLRQNLGMGQQAPNPEGRDRSWVPDMSGRTPTIRPNEPVNQVQPGAEPQGTPSQPGFSPNAPAMAARNATALNTQGVPQMGNVPQATPQVMPQQRQISPEQEAAAYEQAAQEAAGIHDHDTYSFYQNKANQIRKDIRQDRQTEKKSTLDIHKSEKPAYDALEAEGEQAKKTMRARKTMVDQLPNLNNKNWKNLMANAFKDRPLLEGLFSTPERELFKSVGITQFEGMKDIFGVRLSDADLAVASTKVMSPEKSPEANRAIAEYWDFSDKMKVEEAKIAREIKKANGGFLPIDWREQTHDIMQERFGEEAERVTRAAANEGGSKPLKVVNGKVEIQSPEGQRVWVPEAQVKTALLKGGIAV